MNYMNDANWLGRVPRRLCETKWGADTRWEGYDNESRPTRRWAVLGIVFAAVIVLFCFAGEATYGEPYGPNGMDSRTHSASR